MALQVNRAMAERLLEKAGTGDKKKKKKKKKTEEEEEGGEGGEGGEEEEGKVTCRVREICLLGFEVFVFFDRLFVILGFTFTSSLSFGLECCVSEYHTCAIFHCWMSSPSLG